MVKDEIFEFFQSAFPNKLIFLVQLALNSSKSFHFPFESFCNYFFLLQLLHRIFELSLEGITFLEQSFNLLSHC